MKTKKISENLSLNKKTVADLTGHEMIFVKGGVITMITCIETFPTCDEENSDPCVTDRC